MGDDKAITKSLIKTCIYFELKRKNCYSGYESLLAEPSCNVGLIQYIKHIIDTRCELESFYQGVNSIITDHENQTGPANSQHYQLKKENVVLFAIKIFQVIVGYDNIRKNQSQPTQLNTEKILISLVYMGTFTVICHHLGIAEDLLKPENLDDLTAEIHGYLSVWLREGGAQGWPDKLRRWKDLHMP